MRHVHPAIPNGRQLWPTRQSRFTIVGTLRRERARCGQSKNKQPRRNRFPSYYIFENLASLRRTIVYDGASGGWIRRTDPIGLRPALRIPC